MEMIRTWPAAMGKETGWWLLAGGRLWGWDPESWPWAIQRILAAYGGTGRTHTAGHQETFAWKSDRAATLWNLPSSQREQLGLSCRWRSGQA